MSSLDFYLNAGLDWQKLNGWMIEKPKFVSVQEFVKVIDAIFLIVKENGAPRIIYNG
jgi:hypothetical protein